MWPISRTESLAMSILRPVLVLVAAIAVVSGHWSYDDPHHWPGTCQSGFYQSPIDLVTTKTETANFEKIAFIFYEDTTSMTLVNNGHTVQFNIANPKSIVIGSGGLPGVFYLEQMHFHWGSEHTLDGVRLPLELHLVHYERMYTGVSEAMMHKNGLAVVGILFREVAEDNPKLEALTAALSMVDGQVGVDMPIQLTPEDWLPEDTDKFYRYEGSLTTPGCYESVVWTVIGHTVPISSKQIAKFSAMRAHNGTIGANYRPNQPLNGRPVTLTLMAGSNAYRLNSATTLLFGTLLCLYSLL